MAGYAYDGALLDDAALQKRLQGEEEFDDDETFGGGLLDGGSAWDNNQDQQIAEFERLRQVEFGLPAASPKRLSPSSPGLAASLYNDDGGDSFHSMPRAAQSRGRQPAGELQPPSSFHADDDDQSLAINQSLNRLLSDDDGPEEGAGAAVTQSGWVNGGGNGAPATTAGQWPWPAMQHVPPRTSAQDAVSAAATSLAGFSLGNQLHSSGHHGSSAGGNSILSVASLFASASQPNPPSAAPQKSSSIDLSALVGTGSANSVVVPQGSLPSRGVRLEDLESNLRSGGSSQSPDARRAEGVGMDAAPSQPPPHNLWMQKLQSSMPAAADGSGGANARPMVHSPQHVLPPRVAGPGPMPGPMMPPPPHPDVRPGGMPSGPPPPSMPPMPHGVRGMPPPPPWLYQRPPLPGQQCMPPDMGMMPRRFPPPPMPHGMPPPHLADPNWRGPPPPSMPPMPPNFRPPMPMPGMPFPPAGMPGPRPPLPMSSTSGQGPNSGGQRSAYPGQQQQQRNSRPVPDNPFVFMTNREKDWILKVQLIQLSRYSSYMDDYYYISYRLKHHSERPTLALPKLDADVEVKPEGAHGRVTIFEGALGGRISTGSVHCPRQTLMVDAPVNVSSATGPAPGQTTLHQRRVFSHAIERAYDALLLVERDPRMADHEWYVHQETEFAKVFGKIRVRSLPERVSDHKAVAADDYSVSFLCIPKGARLLARIASRLSFLNVQSLAGLLCHHLLAFLKRDDGAVSVKVILALLKDSVQAWSLKVLVCLLEMLLSQPVPQNKVATVALFIQFHSSLAVQFLSALVSNGRRLCKSTEASPVTKQWQQCCLGLHHRLEPHRTGLLRVMGDKNEAAYMEFLDVVARCASGA